MKKLAIFALALVALASCSKEEVVTPDNWNGELRISSGIETRAYDNYWQSGDAIGVTMFNAGTTTTIGKANTHYSTISTTETADFSVVSPDVNLYYPQSGEVDILAYYPYRSNGNGTSYPLDMAVAQTDLLVTLTKDKAKSNAPLGLQFHHVMSQINVTMINGDGLSEADIAEGKVVVKLAGTNTQATYDLIAFDPTNPTAPTPIGSLGTVADITLSVSGTAASGFAIPQALSGASLVFEVDGYGTFAMPITTTNLLSGSKHNYTVTISRSGITLTGSTIDGWNNDTDTSDNEGTAVIVGWDGTTIATSFESGSGTSVDDPYIIANGAQLAYLAQQVNSGTTYSDTYFKLASDINLNNYEWTPIGEDETNSFKGTFDGGSNTISGLYMAPSKDEWNTSSNKYLGLFGCVDGGTISNISVEGEITPGQFEQGQKYVGGIIGYLKSGSVSALSADVIISANSGAYGNLDVYIGGAIGKSDVALNSSLFNVTIALTCDQIDTGTLYPTSWYIGHNVGCCIDLDRTKSANSGYDDSYDNLDNVDDDNNHYFKLRFGGFFGDNNDYCYINGIQLQFVF